MKIQRITFADLFREDMRGRWLEVFKLTGHAEQIGNWRFRVMQSIRSGGHFGAQYRGKLKYHPKLGTWLLENSTTGLDYFFNSRCAEHYTGPFKWENGEIVWFFGDLNNQDSGHRLYPPNIEPAAKPFDQGDLQAIQVEFQ